MTRPITTTDAQEYELSIVMPCLNEAETLATCIDKAAGFIQQHQVNAEIIIADNGSDDGSQEIARAHGARVVPVSTRGYGAALMGGIKQAKGRYVIMADADDSYDFSNLSPFLDKLREGYELVMGNRFKGGIAPGAMPPLHRYLGNPVLSGIGRVFFSSPTGDFHCGLRGFNREAVVKLDLQTTGMEFASEMVVKATLHRLKIAEVPTTLSPDGRSRTPHLRSWRDGWRHLRFLLIYSPRWLFLLPGLFLTVFGLLLLAWLTPGPQQLGGITLDIHTLLYAALMIILGVQSVCFAVFSKVFAINARLIPPDDRLLFWLQKFTLERGLVLGLLLILSGLSGSVYSVLEWGRSIYGPLDPSQMMRIAIPALTALATGAQVTFASFFLGVLGLVPTKEKQPE